MEAEDDSGNKDLFDGYHPLSSTEAASGSHSPNTKREVETSFGLFCVMRKRARGYISVDDDDDDDDMSSSEKGDDFFCSDSDTDMSDCSEFDVISQHVVQDTGLIDGGNEVSSNGEPIPISSVPPDGDSSRVLLLDTCSFQKRVRCLSEYNNVRDDEFGLGISPVPLTKTLQGSGRQWSVCGSVAGVRNITLLGDSSGGACSSLGGEQLDVNVSSFQGMDAGLSQTLYREEEEEEDEMSFSDVDAMIRRLNLIPDDSDSCLERNMSKHPRHTLLGLEHCSIPRGIISQGAIAVLHCRHLKHFIRKQEVIIGRSCDGMNVDIDLGKYGYGRSNISRRQALVKLEKKGSFSLKNLGKRHILVDGEKLNTGQIASLTSCSSVQIRGEVFVFKINKEAVRQFLKNNIKRNSKDDTKFGWCE